MKRFRLGAVALAALGAVAGEHAFAQSSFDMSSMYIGGNAGRTRANFDDSFFTAPTTRRDADDADRGYKLYLGYQWNRTIGLEAGFHHLGLRRDDVFYL